MSSWQSVVLRFYLRSRMFLSYHPGELNIENDRHYLDKMGQILKPLTPIQCTPAMIGDVPGEWISPAGVSTERVILYLHGGAFSAGSIVSHRSMVGNIATACRARALIIDYRLAPEHPYPCALQDCLAVYESLLANGVTNDKLCVMGDSAGGTLTLTLLVKLKELGKPLPRLAACLSPATDLTLKGETWTPGAAKDYMLEPRSIKKCIEIYLQGVDAVAPLVSPLYAELRGLPPLLIQIGSDEALLSDATRFTEKAKAAGVAVKLEIWEHMQHVWQFAAQYVPEGKQAIEKIGEFVEQVFSVKISHSAV